MQRFHLGSVIFVANEELGILQNFALCMQQCSLGVGRESLARPRFPFQAVDQVGVRFHPSHRDLHSPVVFHTIQQIYARENQTTRNQGDDGDQAELRYRGTKGCI